MDQNEFRSQLVSATQQCLDNARVFVVETLPETCRYRVDINPSYDYLLVGDQQIYPEDSAPDEQFLRPMDAEAVVSYLWREGKVPKWIDLVVSAANSRYTTVTLICCGRFTGTYDRLYHLNVLGEDIFPFNPKGTYFPPGWGEPVPAEWRENRPDWPVWVEKFGRFHLPED